jgi:NADH:ubiquinone oxidoreductase subunit F (NADH-binding)
VTTTTVLPASRLLSRPSESSPHDLANHLATHGPLGVPAAHDPDWASGLLRQISESGLVGRGGAGFPAATKWRSLAAGRHRPMVVVNAMEGEPASAKDRVLLAHSPHLILDGAEVVAAVVGASDIVICIPDQSGPATGSIERAVTERRGSTQGDVRVTVERAPGGYVTGEESALVGWLHKKRALPVLRLDKSIPLTVGARPALVHNAETLCHVALIARHGSHWFRQRGTPEAPGSTLVTVTGAVRRPGVVEVDLGTPIEDILEATGLDSELSAVLLGGYGGTWLEASRLATPYAPGPLAAAGATSGVGIIIALPTSSCGIAETARITRYMAGESAGQCGPCIFGLPALAADLEDLQAGRGDRGLPDRIHRRAATIDGRGACRHPDGVVRLVRSALQVFADDAAAHTLGHPCQGHANPTVLTLPGRTPNVPRNPDDNPIHSPSQRRRR